MGAKPMRRAFLITTLMASLNVPAFARDKLSRHNATAPADAHIALDEDSELIPCLARGGFATCTLAKIDVDQKRWQDNESFQGTVCRKMPRDFSGLRSKILNIIRSGARLIFEDRTSQMYVVVVRMIKTPAQYYRAELETLDGGRCNIRVGAHKITVNPSPETPLIEDDDKTEKILNLVKDFD
jgi:hypothetical protein